jgi:CBS domain-containing membrane protein
MFGLLHAPSVLEAGVTLARVGAAALSVALVALLLPPLRASHPPAGATTLLVSLGLLDQTRQLAWVLAGVLLLTAVAWLLNRLAGLPLALRQD